MTDHRRLIEAAFPLKEASLDSVHEKNVRHGHISTLHIWPARRPLAACRAALIATLLPDPGTPEERKELLQRLGGRVRQSVVRKKMPDGRIEPVVAEETEGGVLHWGRESGPDMDWFRKRIREAYGGRPPRVLDPFAGGGAIPFEAMRLGCEVAAGDINPVAWFILKCTLDYPQRLAGRKRPLPGFVLEWPDFVEEFCGEAARRNGNSARKRENHQGRLLGLPDADLSWHVRAWGRWVLERARRDLSRFYPVVDGKPAVAYLWARTVKCKNCRATIPLLKTRWLCRKDRKRVLLSLEPDEAGKDVVFRVEDNVPQGDGNAAQRREHDKRIGAGTMSRSGAACPLCGTIMTMEDIRLEGRSVGLGSRLAAVVAEGVSGKEYRAPVEADLQACRQAIEDLGEAFAQVPFSVPEEPLPGKEALGFRVPLYGLDSWYKLFTPRQLVATATFLGYTRDALKAISGHYPAEWTAALIAYLGCGISRLVDRGSSQCTWDAGYEKVRNTYARFALPITWDFAESVPIFDSTGGYEGSIEWISRFVSHALLAAQDSPRVAVLAESATALDSPGDYDVITTDPPYYDAIPYSDLMDFFYVWLRRTLHGLGDEFDRNFCEPLSPKWDHERMEGELVDDPSRFGGDRAGSRAAYEQGMYRAFRACWNALKPDGRFVVVFAHKHPEAWETLVSAIIKAGFVVTASWPIQTEMGNRTRALSSAALSSSIWLVCRKRSEAVAPGWDNRVLEEMRDRLHGRWNDESKKWEMPPRLREFWDAGIRGPDFVWAATGPALEAFSKHPVVKKANRPGEVMSIGEFLGHVRRLVVDFVVGRVLSHNGGSEGVTGLDDVTTYYLLHRHDFRFESAPAGACIMYAVSCGLSDHALVDQYDILIRTGGKDQPEGDEDYGVGEDSGDDEAEEGTGSRVRLKTWKQRTRKSMGYEAPGERPIPLIDQVHRLMHLWKAGDVAKVDEYLDSRGLRRHALFLHLLQALIELSQAGSDERSLLESISNHVGTRPIVARRPEARQDTLL